MTGQTRYSAQELKGIWSMLFAGKNPPEDAQWALWFLLHDPDVVREGIVQLAMKYRKLRCQMDGEHMVKFASAVMNRIRRERKTVSQQYSSTAVPRTDSAPCRYPNERGT